MLWFHSFIIYVRGSRILYFPVLSRQSVSIPTSIALTCSDVNFEFISKSINKDGETF